MRTCRDVSETIEKGNVKRLSVRERIAVRAHLRICRNCRQYAQDSKLLEKMIRRLGNEQANYEFSKEEKEALVKHLKGDQ